jgi:lantibiotic modifying enzyme
VRRSGDFLCAQATVSSGELTWRSTYLVGKGVVGRDINSGMAGTILALSEIVDELGVGRHEDTLRAAARALHELPPIPGDRPTGLYVGDMGRVAALLRAGQVLADAELVQAARNWAGTQPSVHPEESPDLFHGIAGRLLADLLLWDSTSDPKALDRAVAYGNCLLERREGGTGEACWRIPPGYADLSGKCFLGYAHGAAGIADALLDLAEVTGQSKYLDAACQAMAWIARQATPALDDQSGLAWPASEGGNPYPPFWCHGATGIGRLFLHAERLGIWPDATETLQGICRSVARGARWSGPTLCHGLTGNAEFLLEAGKALGDDEWLIEARGLLSLVEAFAVDHPDGRAWISEAPRQITPDYLVGYAGIPVVLLRLARPDRCYQLSRGGFRYRASRR